MDNPEKTKGAMKNGQSRKNQRGNEEWTIQRKPKGQWRMSNPEKLATLGIQDTGRRQTHIKKHNAENWKDEQHGPHQHLIHVFIGSTFGTNLPPEYNLNTVLCILHHYREHFKHLWWIRN